MTDALGNETTFAYDAAGRKTNELNALNGQTSFAYDNAGRMTSTTDALANVTQFGYDANGNQTTVTDARGNVTTRAYNSRNRLTTVTDALGHVTSFTFDPLGNKLNELNALNQQTTYAYDAGGRLLSQTDPAGHVTSFEYDAVGNRTKVTDANGNATQSAYNLRNLRISETNALGHVTTFGFDAVGNRTTVTDGKGATWTYTFDWANRESSMTQPDNTVEKKSYDANGNLLAKLKPDGNVIKYEYDRLNRLVKKDYPTGVDTTFAYDVLGRRTQMVDSTGTTSYTYDALGRLLSCTQPCGAVSKTVSYTYDNAGNRATMTDPDGGVQTYTYDNNNRLASTTSPYAGTTSYQYDAANRVVRQSNGNATYVLYTYDLTGSPAVIENRRADGTVLSRYASSRDNVGNVVSVTEHALHTDNITYEDAVLQYAYDSAGRLVSERSVGPFTYWYEYMYDSAGNRLALTQKDAAGNVIGSTSYAYDLANKLVTAGNITYAWDANGNLASKASGGAATVCAWDYENRMVGLHDGVSLAFCYNGLGQRVSKTNASTEATTRFLYGDDLMIQETDGEAHTLNHNVWAFGLVAQHRGDETTWHGLDFTESVRQAFDSDGRVTSLRRFDAFGNTLSAQGTQSSALFVGARGYYADQESGLYMLGLRHYSPETGRFISADPSRLEDNWSLYAGNDPVQHIDPDGTKFTDLGVKGYDTINWLGGTGGTTPGTSTETPPNYDGEQYLCPCNNLWLGKCWVKPNTGIFDIAVSSILVKPGDYAGYRGGTLRISVSAAAAIAQHEEGHRKLERLIHDAFIAPAEARAKAWWAPKKLQWGNGQTECYDCLDRKIAWTEAVTKFLKWEKIVQPAYAGWDTATSADLSETQLILGSQPTIYVYNASPGFNYQAVFQTYAQNLKASMKKDEVKPKACKLYKKCPKA